MSRYFNWKEHFHGVAYQSVIAYQLNLSDLQEDSVILNN